MSPRGYRLLSRLRAVLFSEKILFCFIYARDKKTINGCVPAPDIIHVAAQSVSEGMND